MLKTWKYHPEKGGKIFDLDEVDEDELESDGWENIPFDHPSRSDAADEADEAEPATKDSLEAYALEKYGVNLDKRKSLKKLIAEVEALDNGHGA